jgi:hypothetical protein
MYRSTSQHKVEGAAENYQASRTEGITNGKAESQRASSVRR